MTPTSTGRVPAGEHVPVTVLTGFLGAGKTTLLNRILNGDQGAIDAADLSRQFDACLADAAGSDGPAEARSL